MTRIQQVLFELEGEYYGHPYFVTGNALYHALAPRVSAATRRDLCVSHGIFVPGEHGAYPDGHSQYGYSQYLGRRLSPVKRYSDLFLFRDAAHRWIHDGRPRDTTNTHDLQSHGGRLTYAPHTRIGQPEARHAYKKTYTWSVHCYLHTTGAGGQDEGDDVEFPLTEDKLDGVQVGGGRNYGLGELSVVDTQLVELDTLDMSALERAEAYTIELCAPYVLESEEPGADDQQIPWWWNIDQQSTRAGPASENDGLRRRETRLVVDGECHTLRTVDHGQVVGYVGDDPIQTALNGVTRVGSHAKFGFGEFRVRPASADRVPERVDAEASVATDGGTRVGAAARHGRTARLRGKR